MAAARRGAGHARLDAPDATSDPDASSSDEYEVQALGDPDADATDDIARSTRWAFLTRSFETWFSSAQYADTTASTSIDLEFDSFYVFVPYEPGPNGPTILQKLRDATELVAYMLQLDKNTWWFIRNASKAWFGGFFPSNYDPEKLVPKMTFVLHQRFGPGDDRRGALQRLQHMLVDCDRGQESSTDGRGSRSFFKAKHRIRFDCDPEKRLDGFKIPIAIQLRPPEARTPDELLAYLQDAITLVEAVKHKSERDASYPFHLDEITLDVHLQCISDAHSELTQLLALGVPVTTHLRHPHTHILLPFAWTDFGWRANVFPVFTTPGDTIHTLVSRKIHCSSELLSAVAFATSLRAVEIAPDDEQDHEAEVDAAKWLAFSLRCNRTLQALTIHDFHGTHELVDVMETMAVSLDPARLLSNVWMKVCERPQVVRLKPDAFIETPESRGPQTFAELNILSDFAFPVVRSTAEHIEFVVPGHAIASTSVASVLSIRSDDTISGQYQSVLKTLVLEDAYCDPGVLPRFVRLFGSSLEELRWADSLDAGFDDDLAIVTAACPQLLRLYLQGSTLRSLSPQSLPQLRTLSLMHTAVPMTSLTAFFRLLADTSSPLARSLQTFSYYCPGHSLDASATEAALAMLRTNRHLQSISLGISSQIYGQYEARFQDERDVEVEVETLLLATKLALCSVVRYYHKKTVVGQLDGACLNHIFQWHSRYAFRRVRVIRAQ